VVVGIYGDVFVGEDWLCSVVCVVGGDLVMLFVELDGVLGCDWDEELEPFCYAGEGVLVRWLYCVG